MSKPTIAARRYQRAVPVLSGEPVRGRRFMATCQARLGLLVGSTSVSGLPATLGDLMRKVDRGVAVPVDDQTAVLTAKHPRRGGQFGFHCPAGRTRTHLGGRKPAVGHHKPTAVPPGLVRQLPPDLPEPSVRD